MGRVMLAVSIGGLSCGRHVGPTPILPAQHRRTIVDASDPTGEAPAARYRLAYESFWWNCVAVKAEDTNARCPFVCSGTPAAADGCYEGKADAEKTVRDLISRVGVPKAKKRLESLIAMPDAEQSIRRYFPSGPEREKIGP
jgi:hypothetical protein